MTCQTRKLCSFGAAIAMTLGTVAAPLPEGDRSAALAQTPDFVPLMDANRLDAILRQEAPDLRREGNQWQLQYEGRDVLVLADPGSDRMRILSPIGDVQSLDPEEVFKMMVANFHTSLDARYAFIGDGTVVSVFLHPLSSLQERDLRSGLRQVAELANTFGTTYSSGNMFFGPGGSQPGGPAPDTDGVI